ncbi:MAG: sirohydrochlorin chelatase [bacterium]
MKALLLIAHGSRRQASNEEVQELATKITSLAGEDFPIVAAAFLELAEPDIPDGVDQCVAAGATEVIAVPYFLAAGRHVVADIPEELEKAKLLHPDLRLSMSDYLGTDSKLPEILLSMAKASVGNRQMMSSVAR